MIPQKKNQSTNVAAKDKSLAQPNQVKDRIQILKPMLPGAYERMLRGKDTDKHLEGIQVSFYPRGLQDMKFLVRFPDGEFKGQVRALDAGGYQIFRNSLAEGISIDKEVKAAEQFFKKLESRAWVKTTDWSVKHCEQVKSLRWPPVIAQAFQMSQKDVKSKKLTSSKLYSIWKELKPEYIEIVCKFQAAVDPTFNWKETIVAFSTFADAASREQKEKERKKIETEVLTSKVKWGDIDVSSHDPRLPLTQVTEFDPFESTTTKKKGVEDFDNPWPVSPFDETNAGEEEKDPLERAVSPPHEKEKRSLMQMGRGAFQGLVGGRSHAPSPPQNQQKEQSVQDT